MVEGIASLKGTIMINLTRLCQIFLLLLFATSYLKSQLRITYPNGGETFRPGQNVTTRWEGIEVADIVGLEYSIDAGTTWNSITATASGGQFQWQVPDSPSERCLVRLVKGHEATVLKGPAWPLADASFGYNERYIVAHGYGSVSAWDPTVADPFWQMEETYWAKANPIYEVAVVTADKNAVLKNPRTGAVIKTLTGHSQTIPSARFSPDGSLLVTASEDGTARVWNGATGEFLHVLEGHRDAIPFFRFSGDGSRIVTISRDSTAKVWDLTNGTLVRSIRSSGRRFLRASIDRTGKRIAAVESNDTVGYIWDVESGELHKTVRARDFVLFSPDGSKLIAGNDREGGLLYDAESGALLRSFTRTAGRFRHATFSPDGKRIVIVDSEGGISISNAETGEFQQTLIGHQPVYDSQYGMVASAEFSRDGKRLITAGADQTVRIWDLENLQQVTDVSDATFTILPSTLAVTQVHMGTLPYGRSRDSVLTAVIRNPENQPLRVENLNIIGKNATSFSLLPDLSPIEVPAGGSADLKLRFTPSGAGSHEATLEMSTSETLKISLRGEGLLIPMLRQLDTVDFGPREMFRRVDTTVVAVRNMTEKDIHIDSVTVRGAFNVWPRVRDTVLKAGAVLSVRIECRMLGPYVDVRPLQIIYKAVDEDRDTVVLTVRGEGVPPASVEEDRSVRRGVTVHPNPAGDRGTVEYRVDKASTVRMELWDVLGRRVQEEDLGEVSEGLQRHELDLSGVGSGTYLLIVETVSGRMLGSLRVVR